MKFFFCIHIFAVPCSVQESFMSPLSRELHNFMDQNTSEDVKGLERLGNRANRHQENEMEKGCC